MGLLLQLHDRVKVLVVDVSVDPEEALQDGLCHGHKVTLEGDTLQTRGHKEEEAIIKSNVYVSFSPSHCAEDRFSFTTGRAKVQEQPRHRCSSTCSPGLQVTFTGRSRHDWREAPTIETVTHNHVTAATCEAFICRKEISLCASS